MICYCLGSEGPLQLSETMIYFLQQFILIDHVDAYTTFDQKRYKLLLRFPTLAGALSTLSRRFIHNSAVVRNRTRVGQPS
jgi:hypothetical protein